MKPRKIKDKIYWMGFIDWDNRLFDSLIPLPDGTSYNAFLIEGSEKTVLIDTVESNLFFELENQLENVPHLDYVISLHAEQDHSGSLPHILSRYPDAKLITNSKATAKAVSPHILHKDIHIIYNGVDLDKFNLLKW